MSLTLITESGEVISTDNAGPFQYTPEGFNTGLAANSVPLSAWGDHNSPLSFARLYRTQPAVYTSINWMTRQVSRLPLKLYELNSQNEKKRITTGKLADALRKPARRRGPIHLKQWMIFPAVLQGNGTLLKLRDRAGAAPSRFAPLDWRFMEPKRDRDENITHWIYRGYREPQVVHLADLVHVAWMGTDGDIGIAPLQALGVTTRLDQLAQQWMVSHFRHAARPSGGVSMPEAAVGDLELRKELRGDLERLHQGAENAGRPILLPPGAEWQSFAQTAHEVELIEQRKLNREEIAAAITPPQPMVGQLDHATYSNITELHKISYGPVLGPWLVLIEETFGAQVIDDEPEFEGQFVEFDLAEVLRGDPLKEALALKHQMQSGLLTINEARKIKNLPPIDHPDCDRPMIPANNMQFVGGTSVEEQEAERTALGANLARVANRLYRKAKAGEDGWDPARFHRELHADLEEAGASDPERIAKTWTGAVGAIVADSLNDPDVLRDSFAALVTDSGAEQTP